MSRATVIEMRHQLALGQRIFEQCSLDGEEPLMTAECATGTAGSRNDFPWVHQRAAESRAVGHPHL